MDHVAVILGQEPFARCVYNHQQVLEYLEKLYLRDQTRVSDAGYTLLHCVALRGDLECIAQLIEAGADINVLTRQGYTPLVLAAKRGHADYVRYLVTHSAALGIECSDGKNALAHARVESEVEAASLLSQASPQSGKIRYYTALHTKQQLPMSAV